MSRRSSSKEYRQSQVLIAAVYVMLVGLLAVATASADEAEPRTSASKHFTTGGRSNSTDPILTNDLFAPLVTEGERTGSADIQAKADGDAPHAIAKASAYDFWIYTADVILFGDDDADGYFHGIDLLFDADTIWSRAEVYAVLYLSLDGGPWNEYAVTEDFVINGASSNDEYVMVTELQSGYPTGDYDLLIELFDANNGDFLAEYGPLETSELSFLPLEDFNRDAPVVGVDDRPVTVSRGSGGGATGIWLLLALAVGVLIRRQRIA